MIFFSLGLPGRLADWCDAVLASLAGAAGFLVLWAMYSVYRNTLDKLRVAEARLKDQREMQRISIEKLLYELRYNKSQLGFDPHTWRCEAYTDDASAAIPAEIRTKLSKYYMDLQGAKDSPHPMPLQRYKAKAPEILDELIHDLQGVLETL